MHFDPDKDIPDLSGKVFLVTGGNVGLGREMVDQLSKHNPSHIWLAARSRQKAEDTITELKKANPNGAPISFLELDLASFSSIKKAASTFSASSPRLDVLVNNAGIMACPPGLTEDGYEVQLGTNHLGHALLTSLLLPTLKRTAANGGPNADVRIINLSSSAHAWAPKVGYMLSSSRTTLPQISTWQRYGQSKLANIHYARTLSRLHPEIKCVSLHPGSVATNLISGPSASYPWLAAPMRFLSKFLTVSVAEGTLNQLWAATSSQAKSGTFYFPVAVEGKDSAQAKDEKLERELWEWTEEQLKAHV